MKNHQNHSKIIEKKPVDQAKESQDLFPNLRGRPKFKLIRQRSLQKYLQTMSFRLKNMKIGVSSGRGFIALSKLNEFIEDI